MIEIIPAVLPKKFTDLKESLERVVSATHTVQVDVVDGVFAPNKTWPYGDEDRFEKICIGDEGLPFWDEFDFQFDLMLVHPEGHVQKYIDAGATSIVIHAKSEGAGEALSLLKHINQGLGEGFQVEVGVAVQPSASTLDLERFQGQYDFVQVMGIEKVGFQGEKFDDKALLLIEQLRHHYPTLLLQVDGAVSLKDIRSLVAAGANRLVVGSAIFTTTDAKRALLELRAAVQY